MFGRTRKPTPNEIARASFLELFHKNMQTPELHSLTDGLSFDDFFFRALARKDDPPTRLVYVQWMIGRLLGITNQQTRRIPLDHPELQLPGCYVIELLDLPGQKTPHYALCTPCTKVDRTRPMWQAWCPDNWRYSFFSREDLDAASAFKPMSFKTFIRREITMKAAEFNFVARARLGLEP
jgi:hypothetical protein